jgi:hypothetical protein
MEQHGPSDSLTTAFRDDHWLSQNELTAATILDYFARSPFFRVGGVLDREVFRGEDDSALVPFASAEVCYACRPALREEAEAGVFSIERREYGVVTAVFACLRGTLVMAPPLRELIVARAGRAAVHLGAALRTLRELEEAQAREARAQ